MRRWSIPQAWEAAVTVTAAAYGVDAKALAAPSRGRGPRPASEIWEPRKMAVHLAVILADCTYAALGRAIGLHRDTVASHCAEMRDSVLDEATAETASAALEKLARARLETVRAAQIDAVRAHLALLEDAASDLVAGAPIAASIGNPPTIHPTDLSFSAEDHGNVIALVGTGTRKAR